MPNNNHGDDTLAQHGQRQGDTGTHGCGDLTGAPVDEVRVKGDR